MDVRQLETLVAVAEHGSFSAAARALYTVQSNVSAHVARLERDLGVRLVDRERGGLTDDGVVVVGRARRILRDLDELSAEMASRGDEVRGDTRIGIIGTTARWMLPALLGALRHHHPGVHPLIHEGTSTTLLPRLLGAHLDAAIVHLPIDETDLLVEPLFAEDLVLLAPSGHPLAGRANLTLGDLDGEPLILPPAGAAFRRVLDRAAAAAGIELVPAAEIDGVRLMASLAADGFGATIVPATAVSRSLPAGAARFQIADLPRRVVVWVQRRRPSPSAATRATLGVLREALAEITKDQPGVHIGASAFPLSSRSGSGGGTSG